MLRQKKFSNRFIYGIKNKSSDLLKMIISTYEYFEHQNFYYGVIIVIDIAGLYIIYLASK